MLMRLSLALDPAIDRAIMRQSKTPPGGLGSLARAATGRKRCARLNCLRFSARRLSEVRKSRFSPLTGGAGAR